LKTNIFEENLLFGREGHMISTNNFYTGLTIEVQNELYEVLEFQHVKPGKGLAFVRSRLKNLRTGAIIDTTFRAGEKVKRAVIDHREMEYLYQDGNDFIFMDSETYEQSPISREQLGDKIKFLKENMKVTILYYQSEPIDIELPLYVELRVIETEPGLKGDTASGGSKPATLETGLVVQVPLFINEGDVLKIDTRTGEYLERL